jgi:hydrogenase maturation protease
VSATTAFKSIPAQADDCHCAEIGVIGIGNPLMGDDGAGIAVVEKLRKLRPEGTGLFYYLLQRDLFEVADILDRARRFIFVDVFLGTPAGTIATIRDQSAALTPSIHQTDIGTAMRMLKNLGLVDPFPVWEIRGIAVEPPFQLGAGLSGPVSRAVEEVVREIVEMVD